MGVHWRPGDDPKKRIFSRWPKNTPGSRGGEFAPAGQGIPDDGSFLDASDADAEDFRRQLRAELDEARPREVDRGLLGTERKNARRKNRRAQERNRRRRALQHREGHIGDERFEGRRPYFAYGMNSDKQGMGARTGAKPSGSAILQGHGFEFRGGVANVEPDPKAAVKGSLWMVDENDLATLDRFEGYPWAYSRKLIKVDTPDGPVEAYVYLMDEEQIAQRLEHKPAQHYLEAIGRGRRRQGQTTVDVEDAVRRVFERRERNSPDARARRRVENSADRVQSLSGGRLVEARNEARKLEMYEEEAKLREEILRREKRQMKRKKRLEKRSLARSPKKNWIEMLPEPLQNRFEKSWLHRVAEHLVDKGFSVGHAIATGVNAAKKACSTGDLNWPGKQNINIASRAQACAAVAVWEAMKAASKARKVSKGTDVTEADVDAVLQGLPFASAERIEKCIRRADQRFEQRQIEHAAEEIAKSI